MAPKYDQVLILRNCEYGNICGKIDAADVIKLRALR